MQRDFEMESFLNDLYPGGVKTDDTAQQIEQSTNVIEKFFDDLELQCALGEDRPAPRIAQAPPKNTGGEWDIWLSPEAADCPAEGGGCYKRYQGKLVKVR